MTHSSQAGLSSLQGCRQRGPGWADAETTVVTLNTASFELRLSNDGHWYVIHAQSAAPNAQALVGIGFEVGRSPFEWDRGYAQRIQQHLNNRQG